MQRRSASLSVALSPRLNVLPIRITPLTLACMVTAIAATVSGYRRPGNTMCEQHLSGSAVCLRPITQPVLVLLTVATRPPLTVLPTKRRTLKWLLSTKFSTLVCVRSGLPAVQRYDISNGYGASYGDRDIVKYVDVGATYYLTKHVHLC